MNNVYISIIILSKNVGKYIEYTLDKVFNQKINKNYETIVIDSGSNDNSLEVAEKYHVKVKEIKSEDFAHGKTRNLGMSIAKGEILVFLNADAIPANEFWLKKLVSNLENSDEVVGVYSRIYPRDDCNPLRYWELLNDTYYFDEHKRKKFIDSFKHYNRISTENKRKLISFHTISCAIKKEILEKYPFKDIDFGEDLEWAKRMIENGYTIAYEPNSKVIHSHNFYNSFRQTLGKYFDDSKLNKYILNRWAMKNINKLIAYIMFKLFKDLYFILKSEISFLNKIGWLFYTPVIRFAELCGTILGSIEILPNKLQHKLSLVNQILKQ